MNRLRKYEVQFVLMATVLCRIELLRIKIKKKIRPIIMLYTSIPNFVEFRSLVSEMNLAFIQADGHDSSCMQITHNN